MAIQILWRENRPLVIAHRGSCQHAPENTLAACELALEEGAQALEFDAKLSADGVLVSIYDHTVDRTTDGTGRVDKLTAAELRRLDAGGRFSPKFAGQRIPLLEEVLERLGRRMLINVELTNRASMGHRLPDEVVRQVCACGL
jgi:glycerophosphoryl diester phosphodiesterase